MVCKEAFYNRPGVRTFCTGVSQSPRIFRDSFPCRCLSICVYRAFSLRPGRRCKVRANLRANPAAMDSVPVALPEYSLTATREVKVEEVMAAGLSDNGSRSPFICAIPVAPFGDSITCPNFSRFEFDSSRLAFLAGSCFARDRFGRNARSNGGTNLGVHSFEVETTQSFHAAANPLLKNIGEDSEPGGTLCRHSGSGSCSSAS